MPDSLQKKLSKLVEGEAYKRQKISQEGYGTFIHTIESPKDTWEEAEMLYNQAKSAEGPEKTSLYMKATRLYIRSQTRCPSPSPSRYLQRQLQICKFLNDVITCLRNQGLEEEKKVLKWILFNMKLHALFKQSNMVANKQCENITPIFNFLVKELNIIEVLFNSRNGMDFRLVPMEEMEDALQKRLERIQRQDHS